jgi:hypothetical protein
LQSALQIHHQDHSHVKFAGIGTFWRGEQYKSTVGRGVESDSSEKAEPADSRWVWNRHSVPSTSGKDGIKRPGPPFSFWTMKG